MRLLAKVGKTYIVRAGTQKLHITVGDSYWWYKGMSMDNSYKINTLSYVPLADIVLFAEAVKVIRDTIKDTKEWS